VKPTRSETNLTRGVPRSQEALSHRKDKAVLSAHVIARVVTSSSYCEKAIFVAEADWVRMRAMIADMEAEGRPYQIAGSVLAGAFASFACLCLGFYSSAVPIACWLWTISLTVTCCSGVLSGACFLFDSCLEGKRIERRDEFRKEINRVEIRFEPATQSASSRNGKERSRR
jgi:hypothetical protein